MLISLKTMYFREKMQSKQINIHKQLVHIECPCAAVLVEEDENSMEEIQHPSHKNHRLILREMWKIDRANCAACELPVRGEAYDCFTCKFCLHEWCAKELPQEIQQHPLHPSHPLNLLYQSPYEGSVFGCNGCKENCGGFVYHCADCQFDLDVECALDCLDILYNDDHSHSKNKTKKQIINHDSHDHPLTESQIWKSGHDNVLCSGCGLCIDSAEAYSCSLCDFNLHKSCAELPNEINLLHFDANFVLVVKDFVEVLNTGRPISNACKCDVDGFVYFRESTGTMVGVDCAFLKPSLKLDDQLHKHPLTFFEKKIDGLKCNACGDRCLEQIFRCVKCDFNLHFTCAPVLHTIKHECHMDPLTLKKMDNDDETEENYCDACETTRIPKRLVYYCEQCDFAAHIDCVLSEVQFLTPHRTNKTNTLRAANWTLLR
ncbi:uncharacterized protein LOC119993676 [Tripterygium wilfordii]|uniref:uncharacterized protein LOC119993676 n=1 Tax=Tripterygium wilfordii TaxID=458696 RepID=UPI0018F803ED|nr:uncharacterized protein LOC119993676 [Tripterygium wilfordii]